MILLIWDLNATCPGVSLLLVVQLLQRMLFARMPRYAAVDAIVTLVNDTAAAASFTRGDDGLWPVNFNGPQEVGDRTGPCHGEDLGDDINIRTPSDTAQSFDRHGAGVLAVLAEGLETGQENFQAARYSKEFTKN